MIPSAFLQTLFAAALIHQPTFVNAQDVQEVACYAPDGVTLADNKTYVPCNKLGITQDGVYSSCCNLDGRERDFCTTTGLCLLNGILSRGYCTDKTWKSPACVNVCTDESNGGSQNGTVEITPCGDGTYCCGRNKLGCCNTDEAFTIPVQGSVVMSNGTDNSTCPAPNSSSSSSSSSMGATIGLGAALGVVAIASLSAIVLLWLQKKRLAKQLEDLKASSSVNSAAAAAAATFAASSIASPHPAQSPPMTQSPSPYPHDSFYHGGNGYTGMHMGHAQSPVPQYYAPYHSSSPPPAPMTPPAGVGLDNTTRYSELDATTSETKQGGSGH